VSVDGKVTDNPYHLTQSIADGEIEGEEYTMGLDLSGGRVIVNFTGRDEKVVYNPEDILKDAYEQIEGGENQH
jgi:hypothetical protein